MRNENAFDLKAYLKKKRQSVDSALEDFLPAEPSGFASDIINSMRYSLFAGGKRLRPILCIAGAEAVGGAEEAVLPTACALEFIHTYSLIHDDLPVMDDDDTRRGMPTNHKVFGEAMAVLAGDGLLTEAFHLLSVHQINKNVPSRVVLDVIGLIALSAGYKGMVGGQAADIKFERTKVDLSLVQYIHTHKTAALISASLVSGALLGGGNQSQIEAMNLYGQKTGLAFQISDDVLDIEGDSETMGKPAGSDIEKGKATYPSVIGLNKAKEIQTELIKEAIESLRSFDEKAEPLRQIARYIIERRK